MSRVNFDRRHSYEYQISVLQVARVQGGKMLTMSPQRRRRTTRCGIGHVDGDVLCSASDGTVPWYIIVSFAQGTQNEV